MNGESDKETGTDRSDLAGECECACVCVLRLSCAGATGSALCLMPVSRCVWLLCLIDLCA